MSFDISAIVGDSEVTASGSNFLTRMAADLRFLFFVYDQLEDEGAFTQHLADPADVPLEFQRIQLFEETIDQMFFCRVVDSFLIFVSDLLREILRKRPEILAGTERVKTERIIKAATVQELIDDIIDEQVAALSYLGFNELCDWLTKRGVEFIHEDGDRQQLVRSIAIRNLIVHNRAKVDARFKRAVSDIALDVGSTVTLSKDDMKDAIRTIATTVSYADTSAARKFNLPTSRYG